MFFFQNLYSVFAPHRGRNIWQARIFLLAVYLDIYVTIKFLLVLGNRICKTHVYRLCLIITTGYLTKLILLMDFDVPDVISATDSNDLERLEMVIKRGDDCNKVT